MTFSRVYVDSNIFVRAFEGDPDDEITKTLVTLFSHSGEKMLQAFVTSQITLAEILVHPIRTQHFARQFQYKSLLSISNNWLDVRPVSRAVLVGAATLRVSQRLKLPDAIHAETARQAHCGHILTADQDFGEESLSPTLSNLLALERWLRA